MNPPIICLFSLALFYDIRISVWMLKFLLDNAIEKDNSSVQ